jgi:hypothetical protein
MCFKVWVPFYSCHPVCCGGEYLTGTAVIESRANCLSTAVPHIKPTHDACLFTHTTRLHGLNKRIAPPEAFPPFSVLFSPTAPHIQHCSIFRLFIICSNFSVYFNERLKQKFPNCGAPPPLGTDGGLLGGTKYFMRDINFERNMGDNIYIYIFFFFW